MSNICFKLIEGGYPIVLSQQGVDSFTVQYGKQFDRNLSYGEAAKKFGECLMHSLSCEGKIDNRTEEEANDSIHSTEDCRAR